MPSPDQIRKIHAAAREVALQEEQLRDLVEQVSGQRSVRALSFAQAGQVIDGLVKLGARPGNPAQRRRPSGRRKAANEVQLITIEQRGMIDSLRARLGGKWAEEPYYAGACQRLLGKPHPATAAEAAKMIEALKKRIAHAARTARR